MKVDYGDGETKYGRGVEITLSADEVATAIDAYLVAHRVYTSGPRTIRAGESLLGPHTVYVDPSGFVIFEDRKFSGRGPDDPAGRR